MIQVKDLRKGMRYIESDLGFSAMFEVVEDAKLEDRGDEGNGYFCKVKFLNGDNCGLDENGQLELFESVDSGYCLDLELVSMP